MTYREPMYEEEYERLSDDERLSHINYLRGVVMGSEYKIKALEAELAEYKEMTAIARRYQRKVDVDWLNSASRPTAAHALDKSPLDH